MVTILHNVLYSFNREKDSVSFPSRFKQHKNKITSGLVICFALFVGRLGCSVLLFWVVGGLRQSHYAAKADLEFTM
jgi:hypothetical protein